MQEVITLLLLIRSLSTSNICFCSSYLYLFVGLTSLSGYTLEQPSKAIEKASVETDEDLDSWTPSKLSCSLMQLAFGHLLE